MKKAMTNLQDVPGDTDFDQNPLSEDERARQEIEKRIPPTDAPPAPVREPDAPVPMRDEIPNEPPRVMRAWAVNYERRIF